MFCLSTAVQRCSCMLRTWGQAAAASGLTQQWLRCSSMTCHLQISMFSMCTVRRPQVDTSRDRLDFRWRLQQGDKQGAHYGLLLAAAIGFSEQVLWQFPMRQPVQ
jgi:hypothetical protein